MNTLKKTKNLIIFSKTISSRNPSLFSIFAIYKKDSNGKIRIEVT
jgi:hypothetical protein